MRCIQTLVAIIALCASSSGQEKTIALKDIWAFGMPGTKNVKELQKIPSGLSNEDLLEQSLVAQIQAALHRRNIPGPGEPPRPVLVVKGVRTEALKEASRLLREMNQLKTKKEPELIQPLGQDLTLVFYSYLCGRHVHLTDVEMAGSRITLKYRFVEHTSNNMTTHFALIPLGKKLKGKIKVRVVEEPPLDERGQTVDLHPLDRNLICDSVTFKVE